MSSFYSNLLECIVTGLCRFLLTLLKCFGVVMAFVIFGIMISQTYSYVLTMIDDHARNILALMPIAIVLFTISLLAEYHISSERQRKKRWSDFPCTIAVALWIVMPVVLPLLAEMLTRLHVETLGQHVTRLATSVSMSVLTLIALIAFMYVVRHSVQQFHEKRRRDWQTILDKINQRLHILEHDQRMCDTSITCTNDKSAEANLEKKRTVTAALQKQKSELEQKLNVE